MKTINKLILAGAAFAAIKGLDNRLEVTHYTVKSDKIPCEFDNLRIVLFADIHNDTTAGLADAIRNEKPDIICIPGDMTHDTNSYHPFLSLLDRISSIAPIYMTSGNHDLWRGDFREFVGECKKRDAVFLQDESLYIEKSGAKIRLSGIDDPFARIPAEINRNLSASFDKISRDDNYYNILLFHRANLFDNFTDKGFDLILSGHMHGGQFRLPVLGGFVSPKSNMFSKTGILFPKYFGGVYNNGDTKMIVTRGIGNPTIIPRFYNRPEICTIILKASQKL